MLNDELKMTGRALTARRAGAEGGVSLSKRRVWYADETGSEKPQDAGQQPPTEIGDDDDISSLPDGVRKYIKRLREESKERRLALKKAQDEQGQREAQRLAEEGKFKELAEQRARELESLKPLQERAAALEARIQAGNEARIKRIPETMRGVIPTDYTPERLSEWLDKNEHLLTGRQAPNLDAGEGGRGSTGGNNAPKLTAEQIALARAAGMTPEEYAKYLQKRQQEKK